MLPRFFWLMGLIISILLFNVGWRRGANLNRFNEMLLGFVPHRQPTH